MTRPLHKDTRVQRGRQADVEESARGFEASDAPPLKVAYVVAAFMSLIVVGLGTAALVATGWSNEYRPGAASVSDRHPPALRLLADPQEERLRIEAAARRRLRDGPVTIDAAMANAVRNGWDGGSAPSTERVARDHAEAAQ